MKFTTYNNQFFPPHLKPSLFVQIDDYLGPGFENINIQLLEL
jgi:hypothetical protein